MHYKNGREAREGDFVIQQENSRPGGTPYGPIRAGRVHSLSAQSQTCNGQLFVPTYGGHTNHSVTLADCIHAEDAWLAAEGFDFGTD